MPSREEEGAVSDDGEEGEIAMEDVEAVPYAHLVKAKVVFKKSRSKFGQFDKSNATPAGIAVALKKLVENEGFALGTTARQLSLDVDVSGFKDLYKLKTNFLSFKMGTGKKGVASAPKPVEESSWTATMVAEFAEQQTARFFVNKLNKMETAVGSLDAFFSCWQVSFPTELRAVQSEWSKQFFTANASVLEGHERNPDTDSDSDSGSDRSSSGGRRRARNPTLRKIDRVLDSRAKRKKRKEKPQKLLFLPDTLIFGGIPAAWVTEDEARERPKWTEEGGAGPQRLLISPLSQAGGTPSAELAGPNADAKRLAHAKSIEARMNALLTDEPKNTFLVGILDAVTIAEDAVKRWEVVRTCKCKCSKPEHLYPPPEGEKQAAPEQDEGWQDEQEVYVRPTCTCPVELVVMYRSYSLFTDAVEELHDKMFHHPPTGVRVQFTVPVGQQLHVFHRPHTCANTHNTKHTEHANTTRALTRPRARTTPSSATTAADCSSLRT